MSVCDPTSTPHPSSPLPSSPLSGTSPPPPPDDTDRQSQPTGRERHVLIISGSFGEGHDAAAREIRRRLADHGINAVILDIADHYPWRLGRLVRGLWIWQVRSLPSTWRWLLEQLDASPPQSHGPQRARRSPRRLLQRMTLGGIGSASRRLRILPGMYDAVISTHPFASQAIGRLAAAGRLPSTPTMTYLTDLSVHPLWINTGVEHHLALHDVAARDAAVLGAQDVRVVTPAVRSLREAVRPSVPTRIRLRRDLGLPEVGQIVLITGGAEGTGEILQSALDVRALSGQVPVVLCGRNTTLLRRVSREEGIVALGWTDRMVDLYAVADLVVQNAGGSMSLEALAAGLPVITYRPLAGHGEMNAANLERAGLVPWVRSVEELHRALWRAPENDSPFEGTPQCVATAIEATLIGA